MSAPTISVIVPAMNEAANLPHVLPRIPTDVLEVILVDGDSTDDTVAVARSVLPTVRIVKQNGRGKGAALRTGFAAARGDIIVMLDADGSTAPEEIPAFVRALTDGADFAKGSRFLAGRRDRGHAAVPTAGQRRVRGAWSGCCSAGATPTCATATTPSGARSCPSSPWTARASRSRR